MKTMNINFKAAVIVLAGAFTLLFNNMAIAGNEKKTTAANSFVELKYVGKTNEQPKFRLAINDNSAYTVTIKEETGEVLYTEKLAGNVNRTYRLESDDKERIEGTIFEVTNRTTNVTTVYKIKNMTETVEKMVVAKQ